MISGYINSVPFSVYNCGEFVLNSELSYTYIRWTPSYLSSGTFSISGNIYNFSDYSGYFSFSGDTITNFAFTEVSLSTFKTNAKVLSTGALAVCTIVESISLPQCTYLNSMVFYDSRLPHTIELSKCSYIGEGAFAKCTEIEHISLPVCEYVGVGAFDYCTALPSVYLPDCSIIEEGAFEYCNNLSYVDLPVCSYLGSWVFETVSDSRYARQCSISVYLRSTRVCSAGSYMFGSDSTEYNKAYVYVPSSLVSAYKSANNWAYYSSRIFPISQ